MNPLVSDWIWRHLYELMYSIPPLSLLLMFIQVDRYRNKYGRVGIYQLYIHMNFLSPTEKDLEVMIP